LKSLRAKNFSLIKTRLYLRTTQQFGEEIRLRKGEDRESENKVKAVGIILMSSGSPKDLDVMSDNYTRCYTYSTQMYKIKATLF
jgi:hypothetical protein